MRISDWSSDLCSADRCGLRKKGRLCERTGLRVYWERMPERPNYGALHQTALQAIISRNIHKLDFRDYATGGGSMNISVINPHPAMITRSRKKFGRTSCRERVCKYV